MAKPNINNVKTASRRKLHFDDLDQLLADAEAVTESSTATGNWTPAQIIHHVAFGIKMLNHGIDLKVPLPMKIFGRTMKAFGLHVKPIKPGINPPAAIAAAFAPPADVTLEEAKRILREEVAFAEENGMNHPSPLFGRMSPADCVQMNCRHAEMHFGFIQQPMVAG